MFGYLAEAIPPVGPVFVPALAALFAIAALIVAIGMVKLVDAISRAFFGTVSGAIGWIPYAGKVVEHNLHKIEQKISHALGSAELKLDSYIALSWHNLARLVTWMAGEIANGAVASWHLAQQARAFVRQRDMHHAIGAVTKPLKARQSTLARDQRNVASETRALHHSVAQGVYPRIKAGEVYDRTVTRPAIKTARAEAKAAEAEALRVFRWVKAHPGAIATTAFAGAVALALRKLGGGWIRCKNWRQIGKHVCSLPNALISALLGLGLAFAVVIDPRKTAEAAVAVEDVMESIIRKIAD
jgi:hypothetical protein